MLPFPIFLLLLFSVTILTPSPHVMIGFIKTATLQSSTWSTLPTSIRSFAPQSPLGAISEPPILVPEVSLGASPASCGPCPMYTALSNTTIPHSFIHATDDRPTNTAVLFVVLLAMFNCLVYKLLVDDPHGSRSERKSEQLMVFPASTLAPPQSQKSICHHTTVVDEIPPPFISVDTERSLSESLEHEKPRLAVMCSSLSSVEVTILSQPSTPFSQSSPLLHVLSCDFTLDNSGKTMDGDPNPMTLSPSNSTLIDCPSVSVVPSPVFKAPSSVSVVSSVKIDDPEPELPSISPLDPDAAKEDVPILFDSSNITDFREPESRSELHDNDNPRFPPVIEDTSILDADREGASCHQLPKLESDDDETFEYKGTEWTPEALGIPPSLAAEPRAPLPEHSPLLESHDHFLGPALPLPAKSMPEVANTRNLAPQISHLQDVITMPAATEYAPRYASDDIQVGVKDQRKGKITSITRCASADDLSSTFEATQATHAFVISDSHNGSSRCDTFDDEIVHHQVTLLRADAPIFKPRSSGKNEDQRLNSGLMTSIHAPRNEETSQAEGCVGMSESILAIGQECEPVTTSQTSPDSLESSIENGGVQASMDCVEEPKSTGNAPPAGSISPKVSSGIYASIHAPRQRSMGVDQEPDDNTEKLAMQPACTTTPSSPTDNRTQSGLAGSIHAPGPRVPNQTAERSSKHSADAPNWAAAARTQVSSTTSRDSIPAQHGNSSNPAVGEDLSEPPTAKRCAAKDQHEGSVDNSDESSDRVDDLESTTGSGETDSGFNEMDDLDEQDSTTRSRRTRHRGKSRRPRKKVPYIPPPRMQILTQHPIVDVRAQVSNAFAQSPAALSGQYYTHVHPPAPHRPISAPGHMVPPNGLPNHFGQHSYYHHSQHLGPPHMVAHYPSPVPGFQPPGPYNPISYPHMSHPQNLPPQAPFTPLYGR